MTSTTGRPTRNSELDERHTTQHRKFVAVALVRRFDGEWPMRFASDVNDYLSNPPFKKMTDEYWKELALKFRSPHLWDGDKLRHHVWD